MTGEAVAPPARARRLPGGGLVRFTDRHDGDLAVAIGADGPSAEVEERRRAVVDVPWTWLRQVHGGDVVVVRHPGDAAGEPADAAVTAVSGAALAVHTADCAPLALAAEEGVLGAVHAGWRGLEAGVVEHAVDAMRRLGATRVHAVLGPCIRAGCYEFGGADLDAVAERLGDVVRATTTQGRPALDVPAAVRSALRAAGVQDADLDDVGVCTACSARHWSHRARADRARQAMVVWRP